MTLITHIRNEKNCIIAEDKMATYNASDDNKSLKVIKVYKLKDAIMGWCGNASHPVLVGLNKTKNTYIKELTLDKLISKCEESNHELNLSKKYFIVVGQKGKSYTIEFPSKNINLLQTGIFFSPLFINGKEDVNHNLNLHSLFNQCFINIYKSKFDINKIKIDEKLDALIQMFYNRIDDDENLNHGIIGFSYDIVYLVK